MLYRVAFEPAGTIIEVEAGTTILEAQQIAGISVEAPCGGYGACGKCKVVIQPAGEATSKLTVLACQTQVESDLVVCDAEEPDAEILRFGESGVIDFNPPLSTLRVNVEEVGLGDARSDWERLKTATACELGIAEEAIMPNVSAISRLHETLVESSYLPHVIAYRDAPRKSIPNAGEADVRILAVCAEEPSAYAAAFDIGTTTMVCYLLDMTTGRQLAVSSCLNPQSAYGADVVSRATFAANGGLKEIAGRVRQGMSALIEQACREAEVSRGDVYLVTIVGNTCMHHLLAGIEPASLISAPYNPTVREPLVLHAAEIGLSLNDSAIVELVPVVAGFVGSDSVAAQLCAKLDEVDEPTLLVDIGTNGEIMFSDGNRVIACSTAAGPALEGAKIECGMRGASGAIDHISFDGRDIAVSVIGGGRAKGICGSGLIDGVALLCETGIITATGRFLPARKLDALVESGCLSVDMRKRVVREDGGVRFVVVDGSSPIYISQRDVREVQLAKGAIGVGIELATEELGFAISDVRRVFLAGAFGTFMNADSACRIGLIDPRLAGRIRSIGNAAGEGACRIALSSKERMRAHEIAAETEFLELALHPGFQNRFVDAMSFPGSQTLHSTSTIHLA